jgi:hypothetical protein
MIDIDDEQLEEGSAEEAFDSSDKRSQAARERKLKIAASQSKSDLLEMLRNKGTRRILWRWLGEMGVWGPTWHQDAHEMAKASAVRDRGLVIANELRTASLPLWQTMERENEELTQ